MYLCTYHTLSQLPLTTDGSQEDIRLDVSVDIVVALRLEGGASGEDGTEGGEGVRVSGMYIPLLQCSQPPRPRPQDGHTEEDKMVSYVTITCQSHVPHTPVSPRGPTARWERGQMASRHTEQLPSPPPGPSPSSSTSSTPSAPSVLLGAMTTNETTPTHCAVVEDDIITLHVAMENMFLQMLDECPLQSENNLLRGKFSKAH